jgi:RNase H-fold protein (predicted Holliday junction resolvase)
MKKILAYFILILSLYWLVCASSKSGMKWVNKVRDHQFEIFKSDKYTYGDLYGISYLKDFRIIKQEGFVDLPKNLEAHNKKHDLYILGDSYLYSFFNKNPSYYNGVRQVYFKKWTDDTLLNTSYLQSHSSILLIECVERNAPMLMNLLDVKSRLKIDPEVYQDREFNASSFYSNWHFNQYLKDLLYDATLESNLDYILFSRGVFRFFKEIKSELNTYLFGRPAKEISIARDKSFLYLSETTDPKIKGSSFYAFSKQEVDEMVHNLNAIDSFYTKKGFKKVFFSIPANPVSILQTEKKPTNHFIEQLKNHPDLKVELIDASDSLKVNASHNFFKSDSHWNQNGATIWLTFLNRALGKI